MKKIIQLGMSALCLALTTASCLEDVAVVSRGQGSLNLEVGVDSEMISALKAPQSRADEPIEISPEELDLVLSKKDGSFLKTYRAGEWFTTETTFNTGEYTLEAMYGDENVEGFGVSHFRGTADVTVRESETPTTVAVTATPSDAVLYIEYGERFASYMTDWETQVETALGTTITFAPDETRGANIMPGETRVTVTFTKPNGNKAKMPVASYDFVARHRYKLTIDMQEEAGSVESISVSLDDQMEVEDILVDISDSVFDAPAPTVTPEGFESGTTVYVVEGSVPEQPLLVSMIAPAGFAQVTLRTESESLDAQGWPAEIDLLRADAAMQQKLTDLGLSVLGLWKNVGEMAQIDLSEVLRHLTGKATFTVEVMDKVNRLNDPAVVLDVDVEPLEIEFTPDEIYLEGDDIIFKVGYNGPNIADVISFKYDNQRGTRSDLEIVGISEPQARSMSDYTVTLKAPQPSTVKGENSIHVYAYVSFYSSAKPYADFVINGAPFTVVADENDMYTRHATVSVVSIGSRSMPEIDGAVFKLDGKDASPVIDDSNNVYFDNLTPATTYSGTVEINGRVYRRFSITTEAEAQIPESGFDQWTPKKMGDYQYLWTIADGTPWATLNELTTSTYGSGSSNGLNCGGAAYKATSGTIPANSRTTKAQDDGGWIGTSKSGDGNTTGNATLHSDKQHTGANAALIRTVGYSQSNAAGSSDSKFGTCNNPTAGKLFLGTYADDKENYGYEFKSRPSSVSFFYHYDVVKAGNGDYGHVDVQLLDAAGQVIAAASSDITEQADWQEMNLPLAYTSGNKAASISIVFTSSANETAIKTLNTTYWRKPGAKNISGGEFTGSELYVDDITLHY